jgi:multidrug efflux pump subunit AcrA (membrane-fusion protein)
MSRLASLCLVALLGIAALLCSLSARGADAPIAATTFEYRAIVPKEGGNTMPGAEPTPVREFVAAIQRAGQDGWELVGFDPTGGAWLKRRR